MASNVLDAAGAAERLNRECFCIGVDVPALHAQLERDLGAGGLLAAHPHLFSSLPVFVSRAHVLDMQRTIGAVETVVATESFRQHAIADAPPIAAHEPAARGVLQSYDFHLGTDGPRLIEINTNAGGALLNAVMGRALQACCGEVADLIDEANDYVGAEARLFAMFECEWRLARGTAALRRIAIVDTNPPAQYLYPEFRLFQRLFESHGVAATIVDPADLHLDRSALRDAAGPIDLVYNRLTDFYFERQPLLARAYSTGAAVVTPHPRDHALHANKRLLAALSDATLLRRWGVADTDVRQLERTIPHTRIVAASDADALWRARKALFFKPARGHGSGGAYRGAKLTRRVFDEIIRGDYVAQALAPPSERTADDAHGTSVLKVDLRNYVYDGEVLLVAARLYQGQTTNFRTPGGGFAPVFYPTESGSCGVGGHT